MSWISCALANPSRSSRIATTARRWRVLRSASTMALSSAEIYRMAMVAQPACERPSERRDAEHGQCEQHDGGSGLGLDLVAGDQSAERRDQADGHRRDMRRAEAPGQLLRGRDGYDHERRD